MDSYKRFTGVVLRVGLAIVFFYFGFQQISNPDAWTGFVPDFLTNMENITPNNIVMVNGIAELILGSFLLLGLYTRASALLLSLHMFGIAASIGFSPTGFRDFGLAMATLAACLLGPDTFTLDVKLAGKSLKESIAEHKNAEKKEETKDEPITKPKPVTQDESASEEPKEVKQEA